MAKEYKPYSFLKYDFDKIDKSAKLVIYGAGDVGRDIYKTLNAKKINNIVCFVDQKAPNIPPINGVEVKEPFKLKDIEYDFVVVSTLEFANEVKNQLLAMGISEKKTLVPLKLNYLDMYNILTDFYSDKK